jgi:hypothetical protein
MLVKIKAKQIFYGWIKKHQGDIIEMKPEDFEEWKWAVEPVEPQKKRGRPRKVEQ